MINENKKYELIKFEDGEFSLDVSVSPLENTVWLTQLQLASLFNTTKQNISLHISNVFKDNELEKKAVVKESLTTATDGKQYYTKLYNLDIVISVGYRVKSKRGVTFRIWATSILKQYMLNGYSINEKRCLECQENLVSLNNKVEYLLHQNENYNSRLSCLEETEKLLSDKLFYEDQIFDAYSFIKQLFLSAKYSITIIDGYVDLSVLDMLVDIILPIIIYTYPSSSLTNQDINKFNTNHKLYVIKTNKIHDRFIIIDDVIYLCGSSIKDVGKKRFVLTRIESMSKDDLLKKI